MSANKPANSYLNIIAYYKVLSLCVKLSHRESVRDGPYQKTEEGAKEDGQKTHSQPATQE